VGIGIFPMDEIRHLVAIGATPTRKSVLIQIPIKPQLP
jgi:hypothetical protein